jgi:hypothetical protein
MKNSSLKTEWNPELPHNDYAISKYGAEMEVWRGQQEGSNRNYHQSSVIIGPVIAHTVGKRKWPTFDKS